MRHFLTLLTIAGLASGASANCYLVHGNDDSVLYRSVRPPVDLSRPLSPQVRAIWPQAHLVITPESTLCTEFDRRAMAPAAAATPEKTSTAKASPGATPARKAVSTGNAAPTAAGASAPLALATQAAAPAQAATSAPEAYESSKASSQSTSSRSVVRRGRRR